MFRCRILTSCCPARSPSDLARQLGAPTEDIYKNGPELSTPRKVVEYTENQYCPVADMIGGHHIPSSGGKFWPVISAETLMAMRVGMPATKRRR